MATSELLTEVGLLKAMDPERRRRVVDCSDKLKALYYFLLDEIKKERRFLHFEVLIAKDYRFQKLILSHHYQVGSSV